MIIMRKGGCTQHLAGRQASLIRLALVVSALSATVALLYTPRAALANVLDKTLAPRPLIFGDNGKIIPIFRPIPAELGSYSGPTYELEDGIRLRAAEEESDENYGDGSSDYDDYDDPSEDEDRRSRAGFNWSDWIPKEMSPMRHLGEAMWGDSFGSSEKQPSQPVEPAPQVQMVGINKPDAPIGFVPNDVNLPSYGEKRFEQPYPSKKPSVYPEYWPNPWPNPYPKPFGDEWPGRFKRITVPPGCRIRPCGAYDRVGRVQVEDDEEYDDKEDKKDKDDAEKEDKGDD